MSWPEIPEYLTFDEGEHYIYNMDMNLPEIPENLRSIFDNGEDSNSRLRNETANADNDKETYNNRNTQDLIETDTSTNNINSDSGNKQSTTIYNHAEHPDIPEDLRWIYDNDNVTDTGCSQDTREESEMVNDTDNVGNGGRDTNPETNLEKEIATDETTTRLDSDQNYVIDHNSGNKQFTTNHNHVGHPDIPEDPCTN